MAYNEPTDPTSVVKVLPKDKSWATSWALHLLNVMRPGHPEGKDGTGIGGAEEDGRGTRNNKEALLTRGGGAEPPTTWSECLILACSIIVFINIK